MTKLTSPRLLVLAGGKGTRLQGQGVVKDLPKPMVLIAGKPFLEFQLKYFCHQGITDVTLLVSHMADQIESHFRNGRHFGLNIEYLHEETPLGTGGAIRNALEHYASEDQFLVANGDTLFTLNLTEFLKYKRGNCFMALKAAKDCSRFGRAEWSFENFRVIHFVEKESAQRDGYINAGVYLLDQSILEYFPTGFSSFEDEVLKKLIVNQKLYALPCIGRLMNIGTPDSFFGPQERIGTWLKEKARPCLFLDRDGVIIEHAPYICEPEKVRLIPETVELIKRANAHNWIVAVASNQAGVAKGYFSIHQCEKLNRFIDQEVKKLGGHINFWDYCPYHPKGTVKAYSRPSIFRKPGAGMLLRLSEHFSIDLSRSLMIGDNITDQIELPGLKTWLVQGDFDLSRATVPVFDSCGELLRYVEEENFFQKT